MAKKKEKNEMDIENEAYTKLKNDLEFIKKSAEIKLKEELYQNINDCFKLYLSSILSPHNICVVKPNYSITEKEIISQLKKFNIDKESIDLINNILSYMGEIDYNHKDYTKNDILNYLIDIEKSVDEVHAQRKAYHLSNLSKLSSMSKEKISSKFESSLNSLKKYDLDKLDFSNNLIISLNEYYHYLPDIKKEQFSKEYHYYSKIIPEFMLLINDLKNVKDNNEKNQIISAIKKLFLKIDEDKKQFFYNKFIIFLNNEQKIDFLLGLGYNHLANKKTDMALQIYQSLSFIYTTLDNDKKKYYQPIFVRYLSSISNSKPKK